MKTTPLPSSIAVCREAKAQDVPPTAGVGGRTSPAPVDFAVRSAEASVAEKIRAQIATPLPKSAEPWAALQFEPPPPAIAPALPALQGSGAQLTLRGTLNADLSPATVELEGKLKLGPLTPSAALSPTEGASVLGVPVP